MKTYHHKLLAAMILTAAFSFFLGMLGMSGSAERLIAVAVEFYGAN